MKVTIKGYIAAQRHDWQAEPSFHFFGFPPDHSKSLVVVRSHDLEIDVPDDFDIRLGLVANLEAEKQKLRADFAKSVADIERRISELQAIGYEEQK